MTPGFLLYRAYHLYDEAKALREWSTLGWDERAGWEATARDYDRMREDEEPSIEPESDERDPAEDPKYWIEP